MRCDIKVLVTKTRYTVALISPKITLALLFITCLLQKWIFVFTLRKTGPAKTRAAGPIPLALQYMLGFEILTVVENCFKLTF